MDFTQGNIHVGAQNDQIFIIAGDKPALNNDHPVEYKERDIIAKVYGDHKSANEIAQRLTKSLILLSDVDMTVLHIWAIQNRRLGMQMHEDQEQYIKLDLEAQNLRAEVASLKEQLATHNELQACLKESNIYVSLIANHGMPDDDDAKKCAALADRTGELFKTIEELSLD